MPKQIDERPPETAQKPLDRFGSEHGCRLGLDGTGVATISDEGIKVHQVQTGAVHEKNRRVALIPR
jgi:hypothetical protein